MSLTAVSVMAESNLKKTTFKQLNNFQEANQPISLWHTSLYSQTVLKLKNINQLEIIKKKNGDILAK